MLLRCLAVLIVCSLVGIGSQQTATATPWDKMDHGPFLCATMHGTPKGIAIRVGGDKAAVLYDEDTLRLVGGWIGDFITIAGGRDGILGSKKARGKLLWQSKQQPGWANPKDVESFADPREHKPYGPLPKDWAHYQGLYVSGDRTVLAYTVGTARVLESPQFEEIDGRGVFVRSLTVAPHKETLRLYVCDAKTTCALVGKTTGVTLADDKSTRFITLEPSAVPTNFKVAICPGADDGAALAAKVAPAEGLEKYTKGGTPRYAEKLITKGELGTEEGPYAVDTITAPYENPWNSYLRFAGNDFFDNGDAIVLSISGDVWRVSGIDSDLDRLEWKRYATGLYEPLGVRVVDNVPYVICRDQICKLHDLNQDGEVDFYENFNNDVVVSGDGHAFHCELHTDPQGNFYFQKCGLGKVKLPHHGCALRVSKDGSKLEIFATGFRNANGMSVGPNGEVTSGDQQGTWVPASRLDWVREGGFYGYLSAHKRKAEPKEYDRPLCWIPHRADNSCGGQVWVESDKWGPFAGDLLHLSYGKCRMFKVLIDHVEGGEHGDIQGGVVQFPLAFNSGMMRGRFSPHDGQLYLSGMRGWQTSAPKSGGLQRIRYTGKPVHMPRRLKVRPGKIEITFTSPLDRTTAEDIDNYNLQHWNYNWSKNYGSPDFLVSDRKKKGREDLEIDDVKLLADNKTVVIEVEQMQPVMQMEVGYKLKAADGSAVVGPIYNTINVLGKDRIGN